MSTNEGITLQEILRLEEHTLGILELADNLQLKSDSEEIINNLRKLYIASVLGTKNAVICIAGLQGAGKTTMMRNFYGLDEKYLPSTLGRGENIPVIFTEKAVNTPELYAFKVYKKGDEYVEEEVKVDPQNYKELTNGTDANIMYLNLVVPNKYINNENTVMMLLPGFEKKKNPWQDLIEFSVNSSDAAVCVCDKSEYATAMGNEVFNDFMEKFGDKMVIALSRSDTTGDDNKAFKEIVIRDYNIPETEKDRVVCVGSHGNKDKNAKWIDALKNAIQKYTMNGNAEQRNAKFLNDIVNDLRNRFFKIRKEVVNDNTCKAINEIIVVDSLVKTFDSELEKKRKEFKEKLSAQFAHAKEESEGKLAEKFKKINPSNFGRVFFGTSVKTLEETKKTIKFALGIDNNNQNGNPSLPDKHLLLALESTLRTWDHSDSNQNPKRKPALYDFLDNKDEKDHERPVFVAGTKTKALSDDVCHFLADYSKLPEIPKIQCCKDEKQLIPAVVEMGTYYMTMAYYDELSKQIGMNYYYSPVESKLTTEKIVAGAQNCKKLMVGLAGVAGLDILEGGGLDFATKISSAFGIPDPAGIAIVAGIIAVGAACAIVKDINEMNCTDFLAAKKAVNNIYDSLQDNALKTFDSSMNLIKMRIIDNQQFLTGNGQRAIHIQNELIELNNAIKLLDEIHHRKFNIVHQPRIRS